MFHVSQYLLVIYVMILHQRLKFLSPKTILVDYQVKDTRRF